MMRNMSETKSRWQATREHSSSFSDLQRAVKFNGAASPCIAGCRSVCWKAFLLFQGAASSDWSLVLRGAREFYSSISDQHLKYIKHPEKLNELTFDPLADDPESPWDAVRRDEIVRAEILQDVQRLPDEAFYHEDRIQTMILDILFVWCKVNPSAGGYRQGMHELLAPIVYAIDQDAVDRTAAGSDTEADPIMVGMLDSNYIEHDAYSLFAKVMERAGSFYELGGSDGASADQSAIVEKSRHIHEVILMKIDPELATHLKTIEVLPQIFLIRWIRLLFSREFPFDQLLVMWDTIFAFDPTLDLIDLICAAMLLRIRWTLLEADYSVALQLLLRYPSPEPPHGPYTFVDDAIYLKGHLNPAGGAALIMKYTGRSPLQGPAAATGSTTTSTFRPSTPSSLGVHLRQRTLGAKSPLSAPAKFLQSPGGLEALIQGAAKNVIERGEKLGVNQAVRDAVGEIRRNVQILQEARTPGVGSPLAREDADKSFAVALLERRNRQLAMMLDETMTSLKDLSNALKDGTEKEKCIEGIDMAAAKIQFVKVHLEDSSLSLPEEEMPAIQKLSLSAPSINREPIVALDTTPVVLTSSAVEEARSTLSSPDNMVQGTNPDAGTQNVSPPLPTVQKIQLPPADDQMDTDISPSPSPQPPSKPETQPTSEIRPDRLTAPQPKRPAAIPTRSTLAQSSFSWMLEPDTTAMPTSPPLPPKEKYEQGGQGHKKRPSSGRRNNKNAFLFGEVVPSDEEGEGRLGDGNDIFGLKSMGK